MLVEGSTRDLLVETEEGVVAEKKGALAAPVVERIFVPP